MEVRPGGIELPGESEMAPAPGAEKEIGNGFCAMRPQGARSKAFSAWTVTVFVQPWQAKLASRNLEAQKSLPGR